MSTRVLIIDPDEAFAMLLKEGLEADPEFRAVDVSNSQSALSAIQSDTFDMAIVDLGIDDMPPASLLRAIREHRPDLPLMVIPVDGDIVPQELAPFDIRGVLTKPFFLPDLPVRVAETLGRPLPEPAPLPAAAPRTAQAPASRPEPAKALPRIALRRGDPRLGEALARLVETLGAESALLTAGDALVAHAGPLPDPGAATLAKRVVDSRSAAGRSPRASTGHEQVRFGQSISDSGEHLLYCLDVAASVVLTVAVRPDASLRAVRSEARKTADALIALASDSEP